MYVNEDYDRLVAYLREVYNIVWPDRSTFTRTPYGMLNELGRAAKDAVQFENAYDQMLNRNLTQEQKNAAGVIKALFGISEEDES